MIFTQPALPASFFDALEADFAYMRRSTSPKKSQSMKRPNSTREIYHRTMFSDPPTASSGGGRYGCWPETVCSCSQQSQQVPIGTKAQERTTPLKAASYSPNTARRSLNLKSFSPQKSRKVDDEVEESLRTTKSCPPLLTTTIEESHEPDWTDDDDETMDAIVLDTEDDEEEAENIEPSMKRPKVEPVPIPVPTTLPAAEKFAAHINLEHFQPSEISVQVLEDHPARKSPKRTLEVRGRHQSPQVHHDDGEYECLEYVKRLSLPGTVAPEHLHCYLDRSTGHLVIEAPLIGGSDDDIQILGGDEHHKRIIPVEILKNPKESTQSLDSDLIVIE